VRRDGRGMRAAALLALALLALAGCAARPQAAPPFARERFEPLTREEVIAVALREWRLFGSLVREPDAPLPPGDKPERRPGLWQRVGEYWWIGLDGKLPEAGFTGKHDARGRPFPESRDGQYAWSAAFISYVMRIAGAGDAFPYAADHASYVEAAVAGRLSLFSAAAPESTAPEPGDLICAGRDWAQPLRFRDLPLGRHWPGHCAVVVERAPGTLGAVGGNEADAVVLTRVPLDAAGHLLNADGSAVGGRGGWLAVLQLRTAPPIAGPHARLLPAG
jgi:hypothetical protein